MIFISCFDLSSGSKFGTWLSVKSWHGLTSLNIHIGWISFAFLPSWRNPSGLSWEENIEITVLLILQGATFSATSQFVILLCQKSTHQGFSRGFLLHLKIQQRALTFIWPLNASVIRHNGCRIGHVARSNYKKVKRSNKMSFNISSMRRSVLAGKSKFADLAEKLAVWALQARLVQYTF